MTKMAASKRVTVAGRSIELSPADVRSAARRLDPEPILSHYVVVDGVRYPPKQLLGGVTGLDRADFTTHHARRILTGLGFTAGRRTPSTRPARGESASCHPLAEQLRPLIGQWVAIRDGDVLHSADTPQALVAWLSRHGQAADSMFRVPEDDVASTGLAPL